MSQRHGRLGIQLCALPLIARRGRRRTVRRTVHAGVSVMMCFTVMLDPARASDLLHNGLPPTPKYISSGPTWFASVVDATHRSVTRWAHNWKRSIRATGGVSAVSTTDPKTGTPAPWQAMDPVGQNSIVNLASGNVFTAVPIVAWDGLSFALFHNTLEDVGVGTLGSGWSHSYSARVVDNLPTGLDLIRDDGTKISLTGTPLTNVPFELRAEQSGTGWKITDRGQRTSLFDSNGRLVAVRDAAGLGVSLHYLEGRLAAVSDHAGRSLRLHYDPDGMLITITAPPLTGVHSVVDRDFVLVYSLDGRLQRVESPRNPVEMTEYFIGIGYGSDHKLTYITDYEGEATTFFYNTDSTVRRVNHPLVWDFELEQLVVTNRQYFYFSEFTIVKDERGGETEYRFDESGRLKHIRDQLGRYVQVMEWTDTYRPEVITNVLGGTTTFTYDTSGYDVESIAIKHTNAVTQVTSMTYGSLNHLETITDPANQIVTYEYMNADNPLKPTAIIGPGGSYGQTASAGTPVNRMTFEWGNPGAPSQGKLTRMTSPTGVFTAYSYDDYGNVAGTNTGSESEDDCEPTVSEAESSETGEPGVGGGTRQPCFTYALKLLPPAIDSGGEKPTPSRATVLGAAVGCEGETDEEDDVEDDCPICGCSRDYNASGSPVEISDFDDGDTIVESCANADEAVAGTPSVPSSIEYDGNERPTAIPDIRVGRGDGSATPQYRLTYDARGRLIETDLIGSANPHHHPANQSDPVRPNPYVLIFPTNTFTEQYSDTKGMYRTIYFRSYRADPTGENDHPNDSQREIKTLYTTDAAGRITAVDRDGKVTTYTYEDSTVYPAITETRPDGSTTQVYMNFDGTIQKVVHADSVGPVSSFDYTRDAKGRVIKVVEEYRDATADDNLRTVESHYTYGDGNLTEDDLDRSFDLNGPTASPNLDRLYYSFLNDADLTPPGAFMAVL